MQRIMQIICGMQVPAHTRFERVPRRCCLHSHLLSAWQCASTPLACACSVCALLFSGMRQRPAPHAHAVCTRSLQMFFMLILGAVAVPALELFIIGDAFGLAATLARVQARAFARASWREPERGQK